MSIRRSERELRAQVRNQKRRAGASVRVVEDSSATQPLPSKRKRRNVARKMAAKKTAPNPRPPQDQVEEEQEQDQEQEMEMYIHCHSLPDVLAINLLRLERNGKSLKMN